MVLHNRTYPKRDAAKQQKKWKQPGGESSTRGSLVERSKRSFAHMDSYIFLINSNLFFYCFFQFESSHLGILFFCFIPAFGASLLFFFASCWSGAWGRWALPVLHSLCSEAHLVYKFNQDLKKNTKENKPQSWCMSFHDISFLLTHFSVSVHHVPMGQTSNEHCDL